MFGLRRTVSGRRLRAQADEEFAAAGGDVGDDVDVVAVVGGVEDHTVDGAVRIGDDDLTRAPWIGHTEVAAGLHFKNHPAAVGGFHTAEGEAEV